MACQEIIRARTANKERGARGKTGAELEGERLNVKSRSLEFDCR